MTRVDARLFLTALLILMLAGACALFLYWVGIDALEGRNHFQFYADSGTYHAVARGDFRSVQGTGDLITVAGNLLGPVVLVMMLGENYYLIMLFNVVLLFFSVRSIARSLEIDILLLTLLLLVNPLTVSSVLSVNKEIISLVFLALLLRAYSARSIGAFLLAIPVSIMVRWQLSLFLLVVAGLVSPLNPMRRSRGATLFALLLGMSVLFVALASVFESIRYTIEMSSGDYAGSGLFDLLSSIQEHGGYLLIFPLKAAHLLFGMGLRFDRLIAPEDIYNDVWQLLHSTMTLVIFIAVCRKGRFRLRDDLIYISLIYAAVFAISPIYSPRYFYPVYVLWVATLIRPVPAQFLPRARARPEPATLLPEGARIGG